jgi:hypothetical protein
VEEFRIRNFFLAASMLSNFLLSFLLVSATQAQSQSLNIEGVGNLVVAAQDEPAVSVVRFARAASAAGFTSVASFEAMSKMLQYFCSRRACTQNLPETVTLTTSTGVTLSCPPWNEPSSLIELYAYETLKAGIKLTEKDLTPLFQSLCSSTICLESSYRIAEMPYTLNVERVGKITVGPYQEPATQVEKFAQAAVNNGINIGFDSMKAMMLDICQHRTCRKTVLTPPTSPAVQSIVLTIDGVGKMTCQPNQDPADVVENFAEQAVAAGFKIQFQQMKQMMEYFCARRDCTRTQLNVPALPDAPPGDQGAAGGEAGAEGGGSLKTNTPIELIIDGIGKLTVSSLQDPADVVDDFAQQAVKAGFPIDFDAMKKMMEYFCSRRECKRGQLNVPTPK